MNLFIDENFILTLAALVQVVGDVMIAYVVMRVHMVIRKDRHIDEPVFNEIKKERKYIIIGIGLVVTGFVIEALTRLEFIRLLM